MNFLNNIMCGFLLFSVIGLTANVADTTQRLKREHSEDAYLTQKRAKTTEGLFQVRDVDASAYCPRRGRRRRERRLVGVPYNKR